MTVLPASIDPRPNGGDRDRCHTPTAEGGRRRASPRAATMSLHEPSERTESSATDPPQAGAGHAEQSQPVDRVIFGVSAAFVVWGIASTDTLSGVSAAVLAAVITGGGWAFVLVASGFVVFALWLAFSRYGKIPRTSPARC